MEALEVEAAHCTICEVEATGLTSSLSSTKMRLRGEGPCEPPAEAPEGGWVGVMDTKGETLLTASAKGDNSGSESTEALRFSPLRVFTILNTFKTCITEYQKSQGKGHFRKTLKDTYTLFTLFYLGSMIMKAQKINSRPSFCSSHT